LRPGTLYPGFESPPKTIEVNRETDEKDPAQKDRQADLGKDHHPVIPTVEVKSGANPQGWKRSR
jgi:hypothetical protein